MRGQRGQLGQIVKALEGLAKQVVLAGSCAKDLGTSQREEERQWRTQEPSYSRNHPWDHTAGVLVLQAFLFFP